tara:strand:+ start:3118 stop:3819 length:702 start_codon:yes stop_codon:yes gene_type:complete
LVKGDKMSGISRIQKTRDDVKSPNPQDRNQSREIWFKDGDQVFLSSVATGDENDTLLDDLYVYTFRVGNRWTNILKDDSVDASSVPADTRPSHKFAFWAYVHSIIHAEKRNDTWEEIEGPNGRRMFRENVNDYKIISLGFGRSDYVWNQLVEVYSDWGALNKGVIRIKRSGTGAYDTSYAITATPRPEEVPSDRVAEVDELPTVREYFFERYGNPPPTNIESTSSEKNDDSLF